MLMLSSAVDKSVTLEPSVCVCVRARVCVRASLKLQLVATSSSIWHSISNGVNMWEGVYFQSLYIDCSFCLTHSRLEFGNDIHRFVRLNVGSNKLFSEIC
jgi:hypothetical protein